MTTTFTARYKLPVPDFNTEPWSTDLFNSFVAVDQVLFNIAASANILPWANSTAYTVGLVRSDSATGQVYMCMVVHTSAVTPTTFATDRANNPTFWTNVQLALRPRGQWQSGTIYMVNDLVYDITGGRSIFAICSTLHVATAGAINDGTNSPNWTFVFNGLTFANANAVSYDHTTSLLAATTVQAAIDEVVVSVNNRLRFDAVQALTGGQKTQLYTNGGFGSASTFDVGTTANKVVQLTGAAKLPAVDGSLVTNITGTLLSIVTYSGSQSIPIPAGAHQGNVRMTGASGGSGGVNGANMSTGGSGGPGYLEKLLTGLTPGNTLTYTEGVAGVAGTNAGGNGGNGTASILASGTQTITTLTANGSNGSIGNTTANTATAGTVGGTATNGDFNYTGTDALPLVAIATVSTIAVSSGANPRNAGAHGVQTSTGASVGRAGRAGSITIEWYV